MSEPSIIKPEDINPNYDWHRRVPSHGRTNVDYEERINFPRLHKYRLGRAREALKNSKAGSLLCFDNNNIRYLTSTVIGEWSRDKICRYSLLAQDHDPVLWDFGSAAKHHQLFSPWLPKENWKAGMVGLRGTVHPDAGLMKNAAKHLIGKHDFTAFRSVDCQANSPVKTIDNITIKKDGELIEIYVEAKSFLMNQVRIIAGTLVDIGLLKKTEEDILTALKTKDKKFSGPTAPASALVLQEVIY